MTRLQTLFWSYVFILGASSFFLEGSESNKKIVSVVHTESLVTILGGERPEKASPFNTYKVYTIKRWSLHTLLSSYIKVKINQKFFRLNLSDLNHFLLEMSPSLEVHAHFSEQEVTRRFNLALHIFKRKLKEGFPKKEEKEEKKEPSPLVESGHPILYPEDVEITKMGENEPIRYTDFLVMIGLRKNPLVREREAKERLKQKKLEEGIQKIEETKRALDTLQKEMQEALEEAPREKAQKKSPQSKRGHYTLKIKTTGKITVI